MWGSDKRSIPILSWDPMLAADPPGDERAANDHGYQARLPAENGAVIQVAYDPWWSDTPLDRLNRTSQDSGDWSDCTTMWLYVEVQRAGDDGLGGVKIHLPAQVRGPYGQTSNSTLPRMTDYGSLVGVDGCWIEYDPGCNPNCNIQRLWHEKVSSADEIRAKRRWLACLPIRAVLHHPVAVA